MPRKKGSKDKVPRTRRVATSDELANKAAIRERESEQKRQKTQADAKAAKRDFVSGIQGARGVSRGEHGGSDDDILGLDLDAVEAGCAAHSQQDAAGSDGCLLYTSPSPRDQ